MQACRLQKEVQLQRHTALLYVVHENFFYFPVSREYSHLNTFKTFVFAEKRVLLKRYII